MQLDYIIVGQGLAGTLLAYFLRQKGKTVQVIDNGYERSASKVAAGIINPVTGRRYVKSWMVDELIPFARQTYRKLEQELSIHFYHERPILRTLFNRREESDWLIRTGDAAYEKYILEAYDLAEYKDTTEQAFSYGEVVQTAQVQVGKLLAIYRQELLKLDALTATAFQYDALKLLPDGVQYDQFQAKKLVFCEGIQAKQNPFFNYLPFGGAKGEVLIVRIPNMQYSKVLKHRVFIVPLEQDLYWIGSTTDWKYEDDQPNPTTRTFLEQRLQDILKVPYQVVEHRSAIRPTVKDRRPFLGQHPNMESLYIFNGLGTKGASLGPYFANEMVNYLVHEQSLNPIVDIQRYKPAD